MEQPAINFQSTPAEDQPWGSRISGRSAIEFGPNFSDLPLGSVYPFYTIKDEVAAAIEYAKWLKDSGKSNL